jgi:hypothetical protein
MGSASLAFVHWEATKISLYKQYESGPARSHEKAFKARVGCIPTCPIIHEGECPVPCSSAASPPEVAGEAALAVETMDVNA